MPSLGELFVELGVVGNTKELKKTLADMKEGLRLTQKEISLNKLKLKLINDIAKAQSPEQKKRVTSLYLQERKAILDKDNIANVDKQISGHKALASNIAGVVKGVAGFIGALTGAAIAMNKFTNDLVSSNQAMLDLTRTTDIAQGTFQKWGSIGKMLGVENADQQLASLSQKLMDLSLGRGDASGFMITGISPYGQTEEGILEQIRERIKGYNDTQATWVLNQIGINPKMLYLLRMSRSEFEALGQTIKKYQLSPEQTKQIQALNIQLQIAGIKLKYLKDRALLALMPYWVKLVQSFSRVAEMLARVGQSIEKFIAKFKGIAITASVTIASLKPIQLFFSKFSANLSQIITKIPIVGRLLGVLGGAFARLLWPITAIYLILDDLAVFFEGGDSVLGMLLNYTDTVMEDFQDIFKGFKEGNPLSALLKSFVDFSNLKIQPPPIITSLIAAGTAIASIIENLNKFKDKINDNGTATGGAAPLLGYTGELPNLDNMFISPAMQRNLSYSTNNTSNTDNRQINQNISIQSSQPVFDIQNQLAFARNAMNAGWA